MAVVNSRAVVHTIDMYGVTAIRLASTLGANLNQLIKSLFANGEQGFAYDPNDLSTMFQDTAGTIAVTGAGQPVGLILDKSGRNNHAYQTTSASRPILRQNAVTGANYLEFDGSDDFLQTINIDFTSTDKVSLFTGVWKLSDPIIGTLVELSKDSDSATNPGSFILGAPYGSVGYGFQTRGDSDRGGRSTLGTAPTSDVVTGFLNLTENTTALAIRPFRNGVQESAAVGGRGGFGGNFGNYPLYIGRRGGATFPFNGHLYSLICVSRLTTDDETKALEKLIAKNTGVTLSV